MLEIPGRPPRDPRRAAASADRGSDRRESFATGSLYVPDRMFSATMRVICYGGQAPSRRSCLHAHLQEGVPMERVVRGSTIVFAPFSIDQALEGLAEAGY